MFQGHIVFIAAFAIVGFFGLFCVRAVRPIALALLLSLLATNASAQADAPLPPGKPAGVHEAQSNHAFENTLLIGMSVVGVGVGFLWAIQAGRSSSPATATATTSTSP